MAAAMLAGCGLLRPPLEPTFGQPFQERLDASAADLAETADRGAVVEAHLRQGGVTPLAGGAAPSDPRRYRLRGDDRRVGGFVPGRHPVARTSLVVVTTPLDGPATPLLMEAAQVLAERSQTENVPAQTLLVLFGPPEPASGPVSVEAGGLWPAARVTTRITVRGDELRVRRRPAHDQAPDSLSIVPFAREPAVDAVHRLVDALLDAAAPIVSVQDEIPAALDALRPEDTTPRPPRP